MTMYWTSTAALTLLLINAASAAIPRYLRQNQTHYSIPPASFGIFHSLWDVFKILHDVPEVMNVPQVYELYSKMRSNQVVSLPQSGRKPFITIEGVRGSGKSVLTMKFAQSLNATYLRAPPEFFVPFKPWIRTRNKLERNAFHSLSNYLMAEQAKALVNSRMVVMDLYWHGLTAYELGRLSGTASVLPVPSSPVYKWPEDLLVPDIAFYVMVTEESRYFREADTKAPAVGRRLREAIFRAYSRFYKPRMVHINGDRPRSEVEEELRNITLKALQGLV